MNQLRARFTIESAKAMRAAYGIKDHQEEWGYDHKHFDEIKWWQLWRWPEALRRLRDREYLLSKASVIVSAYELIKDAPKPMSGEVGQIRFLRPGDSVSADEKQES